MAIFIFLYTKDPSIDKVFFHFYIESYFECYANETKFGAAPFKIEYYLECYANKSKFGTPSLEWNNLK